MSKILFVCILAGTIGDRWGCKDAKRKRRKGAKREVTFAQIKPPWGKKTDKNKGTQDSSHGTVQSKPTTMEKSRSRAKKHKIIKRLTRRRAQEKTGGEKEKERWEDGKSVVALGGKSEKTLGGVSRGEGRWCGNR